MKLEELLKELSKSTSYSDIENHMIDGNWLRQELLSNALEIINNKNNMLKKELESEELMQELEHLRAKEKEFDREN